MNKISKLIISTIIVIFYLTNSYANEDTKLKIGLLIPISGENYELGQSIIKAIRMAMNDINTDKLEIIIKDTKSDPATTLKSANELKLEGINLTIGPVFYESLKYLDEIKDMIFLSFTNQTIDLPKNVISSGVNSTSQLNTIKKFLEDNEINNTIFLIPKLSYEEELKKSIKKSKIKISKTHFYEKEPTKLTSQIENITNYKIRKQNLEDELYRLENSNEFNKEKKIEQLKMKYTLGDVKFNSVIIADFEESLKSVTTSLLYSDISPKNKYFITLNQWFDESLINEKDIQPIYYPSINKDNFEKYKLRYQLDFEEEPNHLSLLSYDLVGLVYYLSFKNNFDLSDTNKIFKRKNSFKGKIGIFDIKNNEINHRLNFYKIENKKIIKIF
ncbi:ABC transporter substrate-binding protein [Candidatus Pelagibacter sp.]|uniref:ABC transporter substrate-binding protein n=1 Tax=Candidatus Pelagibacter sp. TaxID=2024849 RepID=UPI003F8711B3